MSTLFGGGQKAAAPPTPAPVIAMPDTDSPAVKAAKERAMAARAAASGRSSTLLSGDGYGGNSTLGTP